MVIKFFLANIIIIFLWQIEAKLEGVIQLNRHGARTGKGFTNLTNYLFFQSGDTQLTTNGFKQQQLLGKWTRERYIEYEYNLLSPNNKLNETVFKASSIQRAIFSGAAFITGMYPDSNLSFFYTQSDGSIKVKTDDSPPIFNFNLRGKYAQIYINISNPDNDILFEAGDCRENNSTINLEDSLPIITIYNYSLNDIHDAVDELKKIFPLAFEKEKKEDIYSIKFLKKLNSFIPYTNYHFNNEYFKLSNNTQNLFNQINLDKWYKGRLQESRGMNLITSAIFQEILNYLNDFIYKNRTKYVLYSGHDGNIINMLTTLFDHNFLFQKFYDLDRYFQFLQPHFASSFIIELQLISR